MPSGGRSHSVHCQSNLQPMPVRGQVRIRQDCLRISALTPLSELYMSQSLYSIFPMRRGAYRCRREYRVSLACHKTRLKGHLEITYQRDTLERIQIIVRQNLPRTSQGTDTERTNTSHSSSQAYTLSGPSAGVRFGSHSLRSTTSSSKLWTIPDSSFKH